MTPDWAEDYPLSYRAYQYAEEAASGQIDVCRYVQLACQRHLDDFNNGIDNYVFDIEKSERACRFIELCPHVKGIWARRKQLIVLSPFQAFIVSVIFGWVDHDGNRKIREAYIELPRKNGKSLLAAAIGLYMLSADGEPGAEVYSGAQSEKQALMVFAPARLMAKNSPDFRETFGVEVNAKNLSIAADASKFEPVIGDPGDGASPSCAIIDEVHEATSPALYNTMTTGMGAREQALTLIITTAGNNRSGPCYEKRREVIKHLEGVIDNRELFGLIYTIEEEDDWTDPGNLEKANPNIGISVSRDWLETKLENALTTPSKQSALQTKHLNRWIGAHSAWMDMVKWDQAPERLSLEELEGRPFYAGLDLASNIDVAAFVAVFPPAHDSDVFHVHSKFYCPEDTVEEHKQDTHAAYYGWAKQGFVTLTEGSMIDQDVIEEDILNWVTRFRLEGLGYDPMQATMLATHLQKKKVPVVEVPQQVRHLSEPMKRVEALVKSKKLAHGSCPMMTWMISNIVSREDAKDNVYPRKEAPENKIDGGVALIMAVARWMIGPIKTTSIYDREDRGFRTL